MLSFSFVVVLVQPQIKHLLFTLEVNTDKASVIKEGPRLVNDMILVESRNQNIHIWVCRGIFLYTYV